MAKALIWYAARYCLTCHASRRSFLSAALWHGYEFSGNHPSVVSSRVKMIDITVHALPCFGMPLQWWQSLLLNTVLSGFGLRRGSTLHTSRNYCKIRIPLALMAALFSFEAVDHQQ